MSEPRLSRPAAARRSHGDRRLCAGQERRRRASPRSTSCRRTNRRSARRRAAIEAFRAGADDLALYPDGSRARLREAIARRYGLDAGQIICGNGSDELSGAARARLSAARATKGSTASTASSNIRSPSAPPAATPVVADETRLHGGRRRAARQGDAEDARSSFSPIPTIRPAPICRSPRSSGCTRACRPTSLLVLDAAYAEYVTRNDYAAGHRTGLDHARTS